MINSRFLFHLKKYFLYSDRNSIFVHIPKTAGNSVGKVLSSERFFWIGHDLRDKNYRFPSQISWFADLYSCCFVRNPWDRLVSSYHYLKNGGNCEQDLYDYHYYLGKFKDFDDFVKNWDDSFYNQIHLKPQSDWIFNDKNECLFNFVGKFENLQADVNHILIQNNMIPKYVTVSNISNHKKYTQYYTKKTKGLVAEIYKKDIENFNYSFD